MESPARTPGLPANMVVPLVKTSFLGIAPQEWKNYITRPIISRVTVESQGTCSTYGDLRPVIPCPPQLREKVTNIIIVTFEVLLFRCIQFLTAGEKQVPSYTTNQRRSEDNNYDNYDNYYL